jgi:S-DNA-T family DNA segregation ATPase FtsK/SpoIIIE
VDIPVESVEKEASVTDSVDDNDGFDFVQETSAFDSNTELETIDSANIEDEEDEADDELSVPTEDDDGDFEVEEIPEDEQNEDVIAMRRMFPILDADTSRPQENNYTYAEREDEYSIKPTEINTADEPPFDVDERDDALKGLIEEVPEEPEKPKKPDYSNYEFPPMDILGFDSANDSDVTEQEINENADKLIETLMSFKVTASVKGVDRGPRITRYEIVPGAGVKVAQITNLFDDIQLNLAADGIRMEAPIPGKSATGFEIPN